jgi:hypothetical protein
MIKKYKAKPYEIEAVQFTGGNIKDISEFMALTEYEEKEDSKGKYMYIATPWQAFALRKDNYVVKDPRDMGRDYYFISIFKPEDFEKMYGEEDE